MHIRDFLTSNSSQPEAKQAAVAAMQQHELEMFVEEQRAKLAKSNAELIPPIVAMRDSASRRIRIIRGDVRFQPVYEFHHLWQSLARQLCLILL